MKPPPLNVALQGELPPEGENIFFKVNESDAKEALNCAKGVIKWFGITDDYIIPTSGFAKAKPVERRDMIPYLSNECYYL
jgi:hypothetical protein